MRVRLAIILTLGLCLAGPPRAMAGFNVVDLGVLTAGGTSSAYGINLGGTGVGTSEASDGTLRAVRYGGGSPAAVGLLPNARSSVGYGINEKGLVAGAMEVQLPSGQFVFHAFRTSGDGKPEDLGTLAGGRSSEGYAINTSGQVAGVTNFGGYRRGFVGSGAGALTSIGTLAGGLNSVATGINDGGVIVGTADDAFGTSRAVIGVGGQLTVLGGLPGSGASFGTAINIHNQAVGYAQMSNGSFRGFLALSPGNVIDLGSLPFASSTMALGINDMSQVVGTAGFGLSGSSAFLWTPDQQRMYDLNLLIDSETQKDWVLKSAVAINGSSEIVGNGLYKGQPRAFLLKPIAGQGITEVPRPPTVPEPGSVVLLGLGAAGWFAARMARRGRRLPSSL